MAPIADRKRDLGFPLQDFVRIRDRARITDDRAVLDRTDTLPPPDGTGSDPCIEFAYSGGTSAANPRIGHRPDLVIFPQSASDRLVQLLVYCLGFSAIDQNQAISGRVPLLALHSIPPAPWPFPASIGALPFLHEIPRQKIRGFPWSEVHGTQRLGSRKYHWISKD